MMPLGSVSYVVSFLLLQAMTSVMMSQKVRMCYFTSWAQYRVGLGRFLPGNIDPFLCTHIVYAFAAVDGAVDTVRSVENNDIQFYRNIIALKELNPKLKVLLAVGGAQQGTQQFNIVSRSVSKTRTFVNNVVTFLRDYGFDGLDVDWEFPNRATRSDYQRFIKLLYVGFEMEAAASGKDRLELTIAVSGNQNSVSSSYGPSEIIDYVDYVILMAYDLWGTWSETLGHHSPLYPVLPGHEEQGRYSMDTVTQEWAKQGAPKNKLVLGMATYGHSGVLNTASQHRPGNPWARHLGTAGPITRAIGYLAYFEICRNLINQGWRSANITTGKVPYAWSPYDLQYTCYDDPRSFEVKANYIVDEGLAGAMFWTLDYDDFTGRFCQQGRYPLLQQVKSVLESRTQGSDIPDGPGNAPSETTGNEDDVPPPQTPTPPGPALTTTSTSAHGRRTVVTTAATFPPPGVPPSAPTGACPPFNCKNTFGFFPDLADCSRFYKCIYTVAQRKTCPPGLLFDSHLGMCNWSALVRCLVRC